MKFRDVTVILLGEQSRSAEEDTDRLSPAAIEVFRSLLENNGAEFEVAIPLKALKHVRVRVTTVGRGAALATFWVGKAPLATSAICSGLDLDADRMALQQLQALILGLCRQYGAEPAFDALAVADRPAIVSAPIVPHPDLAIVADAERCLAAAWFLHWQEE